MAVKLTDKEVNALAKKVQAKKQKDQGAQRTELIKKKLPEAKRIKTILDGLPDDVLRHLYSNRYSKSVTPHSLASALVGEPESNESTNRAITLIEADVVIAAHECPSMSALCKKLGI